MAMLELAQSAACNARHNLPERLTGWLLIFRDRVDTDLLPLTHEFLSIMLGVRRAGLHWLLTRSRLEVLFVSRAAGSIFSIAMDWRQPVVIAIGSGLLNALN